MQRRVPILFRILDSFLRHRWLFVIGLVVVSGVVMTALYLRSRTYVAIALTQVVTDNVAAQLGENQNNQWVSPAQQNVNHFNDLMSDDQPGGFLDSALQSASLTTPINLDPKAEDPRAELLKKKLLAYAQSDTLWAISLTWDDPKECAAIVTALRSRYQDEIGKERAATSVSTESFVESQVADYQKRLQVAEQALIAYKRDNAGQLPEAQNAEVEQYAALKAQLDNLDIVAHDAALKKKALQDRIAQIKPMAVMEQTTASQSPLERLINGVKAQRALLIAEGRTPAHPLVRQMDVKIANLERELARQQKSGAPEAKAVTQTKLAQNPEYQTLQNELTEAKIAEQTQQLQRQHLVQAIAQYERHIEQMPAEQKKLNDKTRDYAVLKAQFENLLKQREELRVKAKLDQVAGASSLNPVGYVYAEPTTGKTKMLAMLIGSLILGAVVGVVLIVLSEWADRSLRYEDDAERLLGVPVLALIPETPALGRLAAPAGAGGGKRLTAERVRPALAEPPSRNGADKSGHDAQE